MDTFLWPGVELADAAKAFAKPSHTARIDYPGRRPAGVCDL